METAEKLPAIKQAKRRREASGRNRHLQSGRKGIEPMPINVPSSLLGAHQGWSSYPAGQSDRNQFRLSQMPTVLEPMTLVEPNDVIHAAHVRHKPDWDNVGPLRGAPVGELGSQYNMPEGQERMGRQPGGGQRRNMQFRMPRLQNTQELGVMWDLMPNLIGHDADMSSPELSRPMWNIHLAEKPTSRTQAQQLATWFGTQIATLAEHGLNMRYGPRIAGPEASLLSASSSFVSPSAVAQPATCLSERLMRTWETAKSEPEPFMHMAAAPQARVEGVKVPNDKRYVQAMLQVTSAVIAGVAHQVGVHCHERGSVLAHAWTLHLALQEFASDQNQLRNAALVKENIKLKERLVTMSEGAMPEVMQQRYAQLQEYQEAAAAELGRLQKRNQIYTSRIETLEAELERAKLAHEEEVETYKIKLEEMEEQMAETQQQLDVSLTALYSSSQQTGQVVDTVARVHAKLRAQAVHGTRSMRIRTVKDRRLAQGAGEQREGQEDEATIEEANAEELLKELTAISAQLETIVGMDKIAEQQLFQNLEENSEEAARLLEVIVSNKKAGQAMTHQLESGGDVRDANGNLVASLDDGGMEIAQAILQAAEAKKALTLEELIAKAGVELPAHFMVEPFMEDTWEMRRDEMREEIHSLRTREHTMLELISKMAELYQAEATRAKARLEAMPAQHEVVQPATEAVQPGGVGTAASQSSPGGHASDGQGGSAGSSKQPAPARTSPQKQKLQKPAGANHQPRTGDRGGGPHAGPSLQSERSPDKEEQATISGSAGGAGAGAGEGGGGEGCCECGRPLPAPSAVGQPTVAQISQQEEEQEERNRMETMTFLAGMTKALVESRHEEIEDRVKRVRNSSRRRMVPAELSRSPSRGRTHERRLERASSRNLSRASSRGRRDGTSLKRTPSLMRSGSFGGAGPEEKRTVFLKNKGIQVELALDLEGVTDLAGEVGGMLAQLRAEAPQQMEGRQVQKLLEKANPLLESIDENVRLQVAMEKVAAKERAEGQAAVEAAAAAAAPTTAPTGRVANERRSSATAAEGEDHDAPSGESGGTEADKATAGKRPGDGGRKEGVKTKGKSKGGPGLVTVMKMRKMGNKGGKGGRDQASLLQNALKPQNGGGAAASPKPQPKSNRVVMDQVNEKVAASKQMGARFRFMCKDQTLMEVLLAHPNSEPRTPEWAMKVIDAIYKLWQDRAKKDLDESQHMPNVMMAHFMAQYGTKALVQEYAAIVVSTLRKHSAADVRLQIFSKFLSEEWDAGVVKVFLEAQGLGSLQRSVGAACVDFPGGLKKQRGDTYICTRKAAAIAELLLGARSEQCTAGFLGMLDRKAEETPAEEKAAHFWSPDPEVTVPALEAGGSGPLKRVWLHDFLALLCAEYKRLEEVLTEQLSVLYRKADSNGDGFLGRAEYDVMLSAMEQESGEAEQLWKLAERLAQAAAEQSAEDLLPDTIDHHAFTTACRRAAVVRRFVRLYHTPPSPPEMDADSKEAQDKVFHLLLERGWEDFAKCMERVLQQPMMLHEESGLRAQATKIRSETDGQHRALLFATLLRNLMVIKLDHVIRACSASDTRSLDADVESIQHALKVLYGWNALLEDDHDIFAWMLHSDIAMAQRAKATAYWKRQSVAFQKYKQHVEAHATTVIRSSVSRRAMGARTLKSLKRYVMVEDGKEEEEGRSSGDGDSAPDAAERRSALAAQSSKRAGLLNVARSSALLKASDTSINLAKDVLRSAEPDEDEADSHEHKQRPVHPSPRVSIRERGVREDSTPVTPKPALKKTSTTGFAPAERSKSTPHSLRFIDASEGVVNDKSGAAVARSSHDGAHAELFQGENDISGMEAALAAPGIPRGQGTAALLSTAADEPADGPAAG